MLKSYNKEWSEEKEDRIQQAHKDMEDMYVIVSRLDTLYEDVMKNFPQEVNAQLSMLSLGVNYIYAIIHLPKDAPTEHTKLAIGFLTHHFRKARRAFDDHSGVFKWIGEVRKQDKHGEYTEDITVLNTDPGKCKIIAYKEEVTRYKTDCKGDGNESTK